MQFLLGVGGTIFAPGVDEALCPKVFSVKAWYQYAGHIYEEVNTIDLRPMLPRRLRRRAAPQAKR
jgi:hypothetical protein